MIARHIAALAGSLIAFGFSTGMAAQNNWPYWYVGVHGDIAFVSDADVEVAGSNVGELSFDDGFGFGGALGYRPYYSDSLFDHMRFEAEYNYRNLDFNELASPVTGAASVAGDIELHAAMANMFFDIPTGSQFTPYIGGGVGAAWLDLGSTNLGIEDTDTVLAYQGMAGITYAPSTMPLTEWGVGYRYFATQDPEFRTTAGQTLQHDLSSHNLEFLARFRF